MIVCNRNVKGIGIFPAKAPNVSGPLIVNSNAVESLKVATQSFKSVSGW